MDERNTIGRFGVLTSPWAERYGLLEETHVDHLKEDPVLHSGLAPVLPRLPPRYYDKVPRKREFAIANTFREIDNILVTEESQRFYNAGLATWNLPPFNTNLSWDGSPPFPGGHRPNDFWQHPDLLKKYYQERVEVDEDSWLPFFKKDRWYDLEYPEGESDLIENGDGSKWFVHKWSVDDERIWKHLRFVLDLANRILTALIRDEHPWLEMLLYGRIQLWYELFGDVKNAEQHRQNNEDRRVIIPFAWDMHFSKQKNRALPVHTYRSTGERIAFVTNLLENVAWSFLPSFSGNNGETASALTKQMAFLTLVRLNVRLQIPLCGGTISVAERCLLYPRLAMTVLHELMHAIYMNRLAKMNNLSEEMIKEMSGTPGAPGKGMREPYTRPNVLNETSRNIAIVQSFVKYPSIYGVSGPNTQLDPRRFPSMERDAPITTYFLPTALLWRLQSKAFWDGPVNGKTAFLFPHFFTSVSRLRDRSTMAYYEGVIVDPDAAGNLKFSDVIARWNEQLQLWATSRPWYRKAFATWRKTAWGFAAERILIEKYIEGFKSRDEATCGSTAWQLQSLFPNVNMKMIPNDDERFLPKRGARDGPQLWLLHCLGTLMLAALPMRKVDQPKVSKPYHTKLRRSQGMLTKFTEITYAEQKYEPKINRRNKFYSRISDQGPMQDINRSYLVRHANYLMIYVGMERRCYLPEGWFASIYRLIVYMERTMQEGNWGEGDWLPEFPFQVPPYEPDVFHRWNGESDRWEAIRPPEDPNSPSKAIPLELWNF
ncbi:hypothetical protein F4679DRAFT_582698 [Xylaria curta]|nr:hypothetical protein F4679DRAFT_582698 [Xylaria curta]